MTTPVRYAVAVLLQDGLTALSQEARWQQTFSGRDLTDRPALAFTRSRFHVWYPDGRPGALDRFLALFGAGKGRLFAIHTFHSGLDELINARFKAGERALSFARSSGIGPEKPWADLGVELILGEGATGPDIREEPPAPDAIGDLFLEPLLFEVECPRESGRLQALAIDLPHRRRALVLPPRRIEGPAPVNGQVPAYGDTARAVRAALLAHSDGGDAEPAGIASLRTAEHPLVRDALVAGAGLRLVNTPDGTGRRLRLDIPLGGAAEAYRRDFFDPNKSFGPWQDEVRRRWRHALGGLLDQARPVESVDGTESPGPADESIPLSLFGEDAGARSIILRSTPTLSQAIHGVALSRHSRLNPALQEVSAAISGTFERYRSQWALRSPKTAALWQDVAALPDAVASDLVGWCAQPTDAPVTGRVGPDIGLMFLAFWPLLRRVAADPCDLGLPETFEACWSAVHDCLTAGTPPSAERFLLRCGLFPGGANGAQWAVKPGAVTLPYSPSGVRASALLHLLLPLGVRVHFGAYLSDTEAEPRPPAVGPDPGELVVLLPLPDPV